jgi:hypothetical protein
MAATPVMPNGIEKRSVSSMNATRIRAECYQFSTNRSCPAFRSLVSLDVADHELRLPIDGQKKTSEVLSEQPEHDELLTGEAKGLPPSTMPTPPTRREDGL